MTLYQLSVFYVDGEPGPDEATMQQMFADVDRFNQKVQASGAWVFGGGLETPDTATVVCNVSGDVTYTDGPFAEAKEQIGGYWVLRADDLDGALALAAEASQACQGAVEVRPFQADTE